MQEDEWLRRFSRLRVDVDAQKGRAPHKPLLLLAVLDLVEGGLLDDSWIALSPDLVVRFQNFWPIVQPRRRNQGDIRMPFHALGSVHDRVWEVFDDEGRPSRDRASSVRARLRDDLVILLLQRPFRERLRTVLVRAYFTPEEQVALGAALGMTTPPAPVAAEDPALYRAAREIGRSARFKNDVISGYRFTCALTGYRLTTVEQSGIVEAAHIHALRSSRNNHPGNGLALTPTAHVLFDRGLWSITDDLRILVKPEQAFREDGPPGAFSLRALAGRPLHVVREARLRPDPVHLSWHRREHGFQS